MSKTLEAFERLTGDPVLEYDTFGSGWTEDYKLVKLRLQALDIIEEKKVNLQYFTSALETGYTYEMCEEECQDNSVFEEFPPYEHSMTEDEFDLLKIVFLEK